MNATWIGWLAGIALVLGWLGAVKGVWHRKKDGKHPEPAQPFHDNAKKIQSEHLWNGRHQNIPLKFYGGGADRPFDYYFTGQSRVEVSSINDIITWLLGCEYVPDPVQFEKRDHWQHPVDFEKTRRGDCEDFALWAWRKLVELGHEAEFMVGKWVRGKRIGTHAWVLLEHEGNRYLFESTGRTPARVLRPHKDAMQQYIPFASVDRNLRKKVYNGIAHWILKPADPDSFNNYTSKHD